MINKTARRRDFPIEANNVSSWVNSPGARQIRVGEIDAAEAADIEKKSMDLEVGTHIATNNFTFGIDAGRYPHRASL